MMNKLIVMILCAKHILASPVEAENIIEDLSVEYMNGSQRILLSFSTNKLLFNITLTKSQTMNISTRFVEDDLVDDTMDDEQEDIFEDEESQTSVIVTRNDGEIFVDGIIEDQYLIQPWDQNLHKLSILANEDLANDYEQIEDLVDDLVEDSSVVSRTRRSTPSIIRPEILVVVDEKLYSKLANNAARVNKYVRNFWNAVNLRYKTITNPRIELNIAGIIIGKSSSDTPYLKNSKVSGDTFAAQSALDKMGKYFYSTETRFPIFDLVVTLTGLDMCSSSGGGCRKSTAGFAYVGGACVVNKRLSKINSVALVEDSGGYSGVIVAAHEVAHLLGAVHDGDGPVSSVGGPGGRGCRWSDGYIMSDQRRTRRGLLWSQCTVSQLQHFLSSSTAQCLHNHPHSHQFSLQSDDVPSLDQQCHQESGSRSCFQDSRVCTQLFCVSSTGGCISYHPALEGSYCGAGKVCRDGRCEAAASSSKPSSSVTTTKLSRQPKTRSEERSISDSCHDRSRINVRGVTNCNTLLKTFSFTYCGNKYVQKICCASHALFCDRL